MGGKGALDYLPIVSKASIYVPKVMHKPVMGGNTMHAHVSLLKCMKFRKLAQAQTRQSDGQFGV